MTFGHRAIEFFKEISTIPRQSNVVRGGKIVIHHEKQVLEYFQRWADSQKFQQNTDDFGNICIFIPGTPGREEDSPIILQGHMDMVCVKRPEVDHNFEIDSIQIIENNGWLKASGTTLGADNLVGVCLALSTTVVTSRPPLEILITATEETGMMGATALNPNIVSGRAKHMINLDTEALGEIIIGCAGGGKVRIEGTYKQEDTDVGELLCIRIEGGKGGHSGLEISQNRANFIFEMASFLEKNLKDFSLISFSGGQRDNAIPSEVEGVLSIHNPDFKQKLQAFLEELKIRFDEPNAEIKIQPSKANKKSMNKKDVESFLSVLTSIKSGVYTYSEIGEGIVETSCNLGYVEISDGKVVGKYALRATTLEEVEKMSEDISQKFAQINFHSEVSGLYPGWEQDISSPFVQEIHKMYKEIYKADTNLLKVHAGLECGVISNKLGEHLQVVSFGPTILGAHSPDETCEIASIHTIADILQYILENYDTNR